MHNIISTAYVITLLCLWQHNLDIWSHIQYAIQNIHHPFDITVTSLCHHTHYVGKHNHVCWLHHSRQMYDIFCTIEDITSTLSLRVTIFMISHPLQVWHHTPCIRHHTNCIFVITTSPLLSHPLLCDITPTICVISYALCTIYNMISTAYVITLLCLW